MTGDRRRHGCACRRDRGVFAFSTSVLSAGTGSAPANEAVAVSETSPAPVTFVPITTSAVEPSVPTGPSQSRTQRRPASTTAQPLPRVAWLNPYHDVRRELHVQRHVRCGSASRVLHLKAPHVRAAEGRRLRCDGAGRRGGRSVRVAATAGRLAAAARDVRLFGADGRTGSASHAASSAGRASIGRDLGSRLGLALGGRLLAPRDRARARGRSQRGSRAPAPGARRLPGCRRSGAAHRGRAAGTWRPRRSRASAPRCRRRRTPGARATSGQCR